MIVVVSPTPILAKICQQQFPKENIVYCQPNSGNLSESLLDKGVKLAVTTVNLPVEVPYVFVNQTQLHNLLQLNAQISQVLKESTSLPLTSYYCLTQQQELETEGGIKIALTSTEANLLQALSNNGPMSKLELQEYVWGDIHVSPQVVETHLSRLKQKLPEGGPALVTKTPSGKISLVGSH